MAHPDHRGQGIGRSLIERYVEGHSSAWLCTHPMPRPRPSTSPRVGGAEGRPTTSTATSGRLHLGVRHGRIALKNSAGWRSDKVPDLPKRRCPRDVSARASPPSHGLAPAFFPRWMLQAVGQSPNVIPLASGLVDEILKNYPTKHRLQQRHRERSATRRKPMMYATARNNHLVRPCGRDNNRQDHIARSFGRQVLVQSRPYPSLVGTRTRKPWPSSRVSPTDRPRRKPREQSFAPTSPPPKPVSTASGVATAGLVDEVFGLAASSSRPVTARGTWRRREGPDTRGGGPAASRVCPGRRALSALPPRTRRATREAPGLAPAELLRLG